MTAVALLNEGKCALSASSDATLRLWNLSNGELLYTLRGPQPVRKMAVASDGRLALTAAEDDSVRLWDLGHRRELASVRSDVGEVVAVRFHPDSSRAVICGTDGIVNWDLQSRELLPFLRRQQRHHPFSALAVCPRMEQVLVGCRNGKILVLDHEGQTVREFVGHTGHIGPANRLLGPTDAVTDIAVSRDAAVAVSASVDHGLKVWDVATGRELRALTGHAATVNCVALLAQDTLALSGSDDMTLRLWDLASGRNLQSWVGHDSAVNAVAADATNRVLSCASDGTACLWNPDLSGSETPGSRHSSRIARLGLSPDGWTVFSVEDDQTLRTWDVSDGRCLGETRTPTRTAKNEVVRTDECRIRALSYPDQIAVSNTPDPCTLQAWRTNNSAVVCEFRGHWNDLIFDVAEDSEVTTSVITADGCRALSAAVPTRERFAPGVPGIHCSLRQWDLLTGTELRPPRKFPEILDTSTVSADGRHLLTGSSAGSVRVLDLVTGEEVSRDAHAAAVTVVCLSPCGRLALCGFADGLIQAYRFPELVPERAFAGHTTRVTSINMAEGGNLLVSGSADKTVRVWDYPRGVLLATFFADASVSACVFSLPGSTVYAGDELGRLHQLCLETPNAAPASPDELERRACQPSEGAAARLAAADELGRTGGAERAVRAWMSLCEDAQVPATVRFHAASALYRLGKGDTARGCLVRIAGESAVPAGMRRAAADQLWCQGDRAEALTAWRTLAAAPELDVWHRLAAIQSLASLTDSAELSALLARFSRSDLDAGQAYRLSELYRAAGIEDEASAVGFSASCRPETTHSIRIHCASQLAKAGRTDAALFLLVRVVQGENEEPDGHRHSREAVKLIAELIPASDAAPCLRYLAFHCVSPDRSLEGWEHGRHPGRNRLMPMEIEDQFRRRDEIERLREEILKALVKVGGESDLPDLFCREDSVPSTLRLKAIRKFARVYGGHALAPFSHIDFVAAFRKRLRRQSKSRKRETGGPLTAVERVRSLGRFKELTAKTYEISGRLVKIACQAFRLLGGDDLLVVARDPTVNEALRRHAAEAAHQSGLSSNSTPTLRDLVLRDSPSAREAMKCIQALGRLKAVDALLDLVLDKSLALEPRVNALRELAKIQPHGDSLIDRLLPAAQERSEHPGIRRRVAGLLLADNRQDLACAVWVDILGDETCEEWQRLTAAQFLLRHDPNSPILDDLRAIAENSKLRPSPRLFAAAMMLESLGRAEAPASVPRLLVHDGVARGIRHRVGAQLVGRGEVQPILLIAADPTVRTPIRVEMVALLAGAGDSPLVRDGLMALATDHAADEEIRGNAIECLARDYPGDKEVHDTLSALARGGGHPTLPERSRRTRRAQLHGRLSQYRQRHLDCQRNTWCRRTGDGEGWSRCRSSRVVSRSGGRYRGASRGVVRGMCRFGRTPAFS
ncbi:hypothetical protein J0H58_14785 [bacterium]|nr:hypothetical protein [bacterium]